MSRPRRNEPTPTTAHECEACGCSFMGKPDRRFCGRRCATTAARAARHGTPEPTVLGSPPRPRPRTVVAYAPDTDLVVTWQERNGAATAARIVASNEDQRVEPRRWWAW